MQSKVITRRRNRAETMIRFATETMARHTASGLISCGYHVTVKVMDQGAIVTYKKVNIV